MLEEIVQSPQCKQNNRRLLVSQVEYKRFRQASQSLQAVQECLGLFASGMEEAPGPTQTLTTNHQTAKKTLEKQCLLLRQTPFAQNKTLPS